MYIDLEQHKKLKNSLDIPRKNLIFIYLDTDDNIIKYMDDEGERHSIINLLDDGSRLFRDTTFYGDVTIYKTSSLINDTINGIDNITRKIGNTPYQFQEKYLGSDGNKWSLVNEQDKGITLDHNGILDATHFSENNIKLEDKYLKISDFESGDYIDKTLVKTLYESNDNTEVLKTSKYEILEKIKINDKNELDFSLSSIFPPNAIYIGLNAELSNAVRALNVYDPILDKHGLLLAQQYDDTGSKPAYVYDIEPVVEVVGNDDDHNNQLMSSLGFSATPSQDEVIRSVIFKSGKLSGDLNFSITVRFNSQSGPIVYDFTTTVDMTNTGGIAKVDLANPLIVDEGVELFIWLTLDNGHVIVGFPNGVLTPVYSVITQALERKTIATVEYVDGEVSKVALTQEQKNILNNFSEDNGVIKVEAPVEVVGHNELKTLKINDIGGIVLENRDPGDASWDNGGIHLINSNTPSGEVAISYKNVSCGSNQWIVGLNQDATMKWNYSTSFVNPQFRMALTPRGFLTTSNFCRDSSASKLSDKIPIDYSNVDTLKPFMAKHTLNPTEHHIYYDQDLVKAYNPVLVNSDLLNPTGVCETELHILKIAKLEDEVEDLKHQLGSIGAGYFTISETTDCLVADQWYKVDATYIPTKEENFKYDTVNKRWEYTGDKPRSTTIMATWTGSHDNTQSRYVSWEFRLNGNQIDYAPKKARIEASDTMSMSLLVPCLDLVKGDYIELFTEIDRINTVKTANMNILLR